MPGRAETDLYCYQARSILSQAEEVVKSLKRNGAYEGHILMAAQCITALRHLSRIIEDHHRHCASDAVAAAVDPPIAVKRRWWSIARRRSGSEDRAIEASV